MPSSNWTGTAPEYAIYTALKKLGVDFEFQSSQMGGRLSRGGAILDFYIPDRSLAINIQGLYWHYGSTPRVMNEQLQRAMLESQGIRVIYIDEDAALSNALFYVRDALNGIDHSRMTG